MATRTLAALVVGGMLLVVWPDAAAAEVELGARLGYYTDAEDPFVGAEVVVPLSDSVRLNPNFEYVISPDRDQYNLNLDAFYVIPSERTYFFWVGGGVALYTVNDHTDVFTDFITGIGLTRESIVPYFQLKIVAKDDAEIVLAFGLRF